MTRRGTWIAALVVVLSNAGALGYAWWNRAGGVQAEMVLTEREVRLLPRDSGNTAIALRLAWIDPSIAAAEPRLDATTLAGLGLRCEEPLTGRNAERCRMQPPHGAYVALEFEGETWNRYLASLAPGAARDAAEAGPHLVVVGAGRDPSALRAKHPDRRRVLIAPGTVEVTVIQPTVSGPRLAGRVNTVYPLEISVPRELRTNLASLPAPTVLAPARGPFSWRETALAHGPRFRVTLRWGRSLEPWVVATERTQPARP